jgi:NAD(P)H-dependent FMN reductase
MGRNVLVISSSMRQGSNSDALAEKFAAGAGDAGNTVEKINLRDKTIGFCRGCLACQKTGRCVIRDNADAIAQKMLKADVVAFATPVYYYGLSGQMKTMLDRANPLFPSPYAFRDVYLLTASTEGPEAADGAVEGLEHWLDCFEKARLAGVVRGGGVTSPGEIAGSPALDQAYRMGKNV